MRINTVIDTIKLKVEFSSRDKREETVNALHRLLDDIQVDMRHRKVFFGKAKKYYKEEHRLTLSGHHKELYNRLTLGVISLGSYGKKDKYGMNYKVYYLNVEFAGLVKYHEVRDSIAKKKLLQIVGYFNSKHISYKITQLDVAVDLFTKYENVVVLCTRKYPKRAYYKALEEQPNDDTTYIEKISKDKLSTTIVRSYLYDKTKKEKLDYNITRFEVKLQSPSYGNLNSIMGVLDRYHILFINNPKIKKQVKERYDSYDVLRYHDIKKMDIDKFRKYAYGPEIMMFFNDLYNAKCEKKLQRLNPYKY